MNQGTLADDQHVRTRCVGRVVVGNALGTDPELVSNGNSSTRRKWRRLTLRMASLIISEKTNQHCYATMKIQLGEVGLGVVVDACAKLTSVRAMSGGGGGLFGCRGGSGSLLGRHLVWYGVREMMDG
jgi:hypothetical protein